MSEALPYIDIRQSFWREQFQHGLSFDQYLETGEATHANRWREFAQKISLTESQQECISSFTRQINVLVMSGVWCGDCARQGPMLRAIECASDKLSFRYLDNKENSDLQNELHLNGAKKVPVIVALSEDFFEVGRFGDRHLSVYRRKLESELGPACDAGILPPSPDELQQELQEWVEYFERIHIMLRLAPMLRRKYND